MYANDTQLYYPVRLDKHTKANKTVEGCITAIKNRMTCNKLRLNDNNVFFHNKFIHA